MTSSHCTHINDSARTIAKPIRLQHLHWCSSRILLFWLFRMFLMTSPILGFAYIRVSESGFFLGMLLSELYSRLSKVCMFLYFSWVHQNRLNTGMDWEIQGDWKTFRGRVNVHNWGLPVKWNDCEWNANHWNLTWNTSFPPRKSKLLRWSFACVQTSISFHAEVIKHCC